MTIWPPNFSDQLNRAFDLRRPSGWWKIFYPIVVCSWGTLLVLGSLLQTLIQCCSLKADHIILRSEKCWSFAKFCLRPRNYTSVEKPLLVYKMYNLHQTTHVNLEPNKGRYFSVSSLTFWNRLGTLLQTCSCGTEHTLHILKLRTLTNVSNTQSKNQNSALYFYFF